MEVMTLAMNSFSVSCGIYAWKLFTLTWMFPIIISFDEVLPILANCKFITPEYAILTWLFMNALNIYVRHLGFIGQLSQLRACVLIL